MRQLGIIAVALVLLSACGGTGGGGQQARSGVEALTVMSRNLYVGADITRLATVSTPEQLAEVAASIFADVEATDFAERAAAIADEIARYLPDVVGLQEVALWRTQNPPDGVASPAAEVAYDFLELLLLELRARGLDYEPAAVFEGTDVEVQGSAFDVRLTDRDVILARGDLHVTGARAAPYPTNLALPSPLGGSIVVERGWASVDIELDDRALRFLTTHLEVAAFSAVQEAQADELLALLSDTALPVVLAGDFNSRADGAETATYSILVDSGLVDAWRASQPDTAGLSCCHEPDLRNPEPTLNARIDLVLVPQDLVVRDADVLGDEVGDRTPSGLWPSDHAGVIATVGVPAVR